MEKPATETSEHSAQQKIRDSVAYSARMQEAMRHNRLSSSDYHLVMTILHAVSHGDTEEQWKTEQQQKRKTFYHPSLEKETSSVDIDDKATSTNTDNDYGQLVRHLKDLALWPW